MRAAACASSTSARRATTSTRRPTRVAADPARHRHRADAGAVPRAGHRGPARRELPRPLHRRLRQVRAYLPATRTAWRRPRVGGRRSPASPARRIVALAREMAAARTMIAVAWSLQRAEHGEQPVWALVPLAAHARPDRPAGRRLRLRLRLDGNIGQPRPLVAGPTLPQGINPVRDFIPVARIADMLLRPGATYDYNGERRTLSRHPAGLLGGRQPVPPPPGPQPAARGAGAAGDDRRARAVLDADRRHADIVLPATTTLERDDIGAARATPTSSRCSSAREPFGEARDDYAIFAALAERLGAGERSPRAATPRLAARTSTRQARGSRPRPGVALPDFDAFWAGRRSPRPSGRSRRTVLLAAFRADPAAHPLNTPSGKIEIFSETHRRLRLRRLPRPPGLAGADGVARRRAAARFPLHLLSPPARRAAAQPVRLRPAQRRRARSPGASRSDAPRRRRRRAASPTATSCASSTTAAPAWPPRGSRPHPPRRGAAADRRLVRPAIRRRRPLWARQPQRAHPRRRRAPLARAASPRPAWSRSSASTARAAGDGARFAGVCTKDPNRC